MRIGRFDLGKDILIIAEIGNNHEGSYALAEKMIGLAAESGAHAVKFQTIVPERLVSITEKKRLSQLKKFRLSYSEFEKLSKVAKRENVIFLSTPFDIESARFLEALVPAYKIASGDNNFFALIEIIARTGKPILLSSGLTDLTQIIKTKDFIQKIWRQYGIKQELVVLHCVSAYPVSHDEVNLLAIRKLQDQLCLTVGYSDHTVGIEAPVLAVALGARIIEKHFTIDKNYSDFRDHKISADPKEFKLMTERIKFAKEVLGQEDKCLQNCEKGLVDVLRRSIAAARDLKKGNVLTSSDITWLRPGKGLACGSEKYILGKVLNKSLKQGEIIFEENLC